MKRLIILLALILLYPQLALAQAPTRLCVYKTADGSCIPSLFPSPSAALAANQVVSAVPANLYSFEVSADATLSGAAWWILIYDAIAAPTDGAVTPVKCYALASGATSFKETFFYPIQFVTGIVIGVSTTGCFNKTASVHAFISGDAR